MPQYAWNDKYSVGIQTIDSQHANLFCILNELSDAMKCGQGKAVVGPLLKELLQYTRVHFAEEEKMMARVGYPDLANHRLAHTALTQKVADFVVRFDSGEMALSIELLDFLNGWLGNHILGTDKKYSPHMKEKGLQ